MRLLKETKEFRAESEAEAKAIVEKFQEEGLEKGFAVSKWSADHKTKKAKGEIIDECFLLKVTIEIADIWGDI